MYAVCNTQLKESKLLGIQIIRVNSNNINSYNKNNDIDISRDQDYKGSKLLGI